MPFKCEKCNKEFKRKKYLMNHINKNICDKYNNLPYTCEYCNKKYLLKRTLSAHIREKHYEQFQEKKKGSKNKFSCQLCKKVFSNQSNLNKHLLLNRCTKVKNGKTTNISITNNSVNINNTININIDFGRERLDDWINDVGKQIVNKCIRNLNALPGNLIEAKHIMVKQNRNIYLPSDEDKYKDMYIYSNGWKKMKTSLVLDKMLVNISNDIYDIINNDEKYKLRLSKKLKKELDKKMTTIQTDNFLKGPVVNLLLKNREILSDNFNETQPIIL